MIIIAYFIIALIIFCIFLIGYFVGKQAVIEEQRLIEFNKKLENEKND